MRIRGRRGSAVVETALMMPWLVFLFVGVMDSGFYSYAAISVENAARAVAVLGAADTGAIGTTKVCTAALSELNMLPNVGLGASTCLGSAAGLSDSSPVAAWVDKLCSAGCVAQCADCTLNATAVSARATVAYRTIQLVPIPLVLTGKTTITRVVEVRANQ